MFLGLSEKSKLPEFLRQFENAGVMHSSGLEMGMVNPNTFKDTTQDAAEEVKSLVDEIQAIDETKLQSNIGRYALAGSAALGAGMYTLDRSGNKKFSVKDTITGLKDKWSNFNLKDTTSKLKGNFVDFVSTKYDGKIFSNPISDAKQTFSDIKGLKNIAGKGFGYGIKSAGKVAQVLKR